MSGSCSHRATIPAKTPPKIGNTMKIQRSANAQSRVKTAVASDRTGLTLAFVTGMRIRCANVSPKPMGMGADCLNYVNRATRLLGDGIALVRDMANVLKGSDTEILAASIKSPEEAAASLQAGADHLTLPLVMLQAITTHEFSQKTVEEFAKGGIGLSNS